ncbi:hypothetical protein [Flavitalea sp.]|nr:hypothetical protein [Flavitalea sp.]
MSQLQNEALIAAKRVLAATITTDRSNTFPSSVLRLVDYDLAGAWGYQFAVEQFIKAIANPEISALLKQEMCGSHYSDFVDAVLNLSVFLEDIKSPELNIQIMVALLENGSCDKSDEDLQTLVDDLTEQAEIAESAKQIKSRRNQLTKAA